MIINGKPRIYICGLRKEDLSGSLDTVVAHLRRMEDEAKTPLYFHSYSSDDYEWTLEIDVYRELTQEERAAWDLEEQKKAKHLEYLESLCGQPAADFQI